MTYLYKINVRYHAYLFGTCPILSVANAVEGQYIKDCGVQIRRIALCRHCAPVVGSEAKSDGTDHGSSAPHDEYDVCQDKRWKGRWKGREKERWKREWKII